MRDEEDEFQYWLDVGIQAGWISPPFCEAHDGVFFTPVEMAKDGKEGFDLMDHCVRSVRLLFGVE